MIFAGLKMERIVLVRLNMRCIIMRMGIFTTNSSERAPI